MNWLLNKGHLLAEVHLSQEYKPLLTVFNE